MKMPLPPFWQSQHGLSFSTICGFRQPLEVLECIPVGKADDAITFLRIVQDPMTSRSRPTALCCVSKQGRIPQSSSSQRCLVKGCLTACAPLIPSSGFYGSLFAPFVVGPGHQVGFPFPPGWALSQELLHFQANRRPLGPPIGCPDLSKSQPTFRLMTPLSSQQSFPWRGREALHHQLCGLSIQGFAESAGRRPYSPLHPSNRLLGLKFFVIYFFNSRPQLTVSVSFLSPRSVFSLSLALSPPHSVPLVLSCAPAT